MKVKMKIDKTDDMDKLPIKVKITDGTYKGEKVIDLKVIQPGDLEYNETENKKN